MTANKMKIAVLVSGGVDSAVVVDMLYKEGHDLHLYYIRIGRDDDSGDCNAQEDIEICNLIARKYDLPLHVVELHQEYWDNVMQYALETVKGGLTPHPDIMCNKIIKFGYFEQRWGKDYDKTATGHYASIVYENGKYWLGTAVDAVKDQTDFLAQISYSQLQHLMFPLGKLPKSEVRRIAESISLPNAGRKDSQGICFLGKIDYNDFLRRHIGEKTGAVIEIETGKKVGEHKGYWFHTIGQRKGLGLSGGPWYVVRKNVRNNVLYVSRGYDTSLQYGREMYLCDMHWITENPFDKAECNQISVAFKNRHTPHFTPATLTYTTEGDYIVETVEDIQGIAPGQFGVIYTPDKKICLGSGVIASGANKLKK